MCQRVALSSEQTLYMRTLSGIILSILRYNGWKTGVFNIYAYKHRHCASSIWFNVAPYLITCVHIISTSHYANFWCFLLWVAEK